MSDGPLPYQFSADVFLAPSLAAVNGLRLPDDDKNGPACKYLSHHGIFEWVDGFWKLTPIGLIKARGIFESLLNKDRDNNTHQSLKLLKISRVYSGSVETEDGTIWDMMPMDDERYRFIPQAGDYLVEHEDGRISALPKTIFREVNVE